MSAFSRWSYGIVMWEIFTIGKYGQNTTGRKEMRLILLNFVLSMVLSLFLLGILKY